MFSIAAGINLYLRFGGTMFYLVLTVPNWRDTTMSAVAPRLITRDPAEALQAARAAQTDKDVPFVSMVFIYQLEEGHHYLMRDFRCPADEDMIREFAYIARPAADGWSEVMGAEFLESLAKEATTA